MPRVLVVDDDRSVRGALAHLLRVHGHTPLEAATVAEARTRLADDAPDIVLLDQCLPDGDGLTLLSTLSTHCPDTAAIVLTGHGTIDMAVHAVKKGAEQFLVKPVDGKVLLVVIDRILQDRRNRARQLAASRPRPGRAPRDPFLGDSAAIRRLANETRQALETDRPVLLLGETGSGKSILARWIHDHGPRRDEAYVDLNCAGLADELLDSELYGYEPGAFTGASRAKPGLLEVAHRGTLFLDEVGDMTAPIQARLLKVLEELRVRRLGGLTDRRVDVRLITATHQEVPRLLESGRLRRDLYFRISTLTLRLPPLRERAEDIPDLAAALVADFAAELGRPVPALTPDARERLQRYAWPGNVRELRNVLERAMLRGVTRHIEAGDLRFDDDTEPDALAAGRTGGTGHESDLSTPLAEIERRHIQRVLRAQDAHVERAARVLGISTSSLYQRLRRYNIEHRCWCRRTEPGELAPTGRGALP